MFLGVVMIIFHQIKLILHHLYKNHTLRTNYIEADIEEDIDMKNKYYIKNLPSAIDLDDAISKRYGDTNYLKISNYDNDSIVRNNTHTNFNNNALLGLSSIYLWIRDPEFDYKPLLNNM